MMLKDTLREVVRSQRKDLDSSEYGVEREMLGEIDLAIPFAVVLSGVRRCGKSTLLRQLAKKVVHYYFNFEDSRVAGFEPSDFQKLDDVLHDEFGERGYYFFDEIQNVEKWELFVRAGLDKSKKFVITGSNASLLSRELGTRLTGRHLRHELFPFSFKEFLALEGKKPGVNAFDEYLRLGGFPAYLRFGKQNILRELLNDVIERDILARHSIRDSKTVKELALHLLTNSGKEFSYTGLKNSFGLGSTNTAISFVSFLEDSYLLFTVPRFEYSLKKQRVNPKKAYSVDTGLSAANSASFSADSGRALENAVFLHLRRKHREIFYFKRKGECDFIARENKLAAFQACYELTEDNKERELNGLVEALTELKLASGLLITRDQTDSFTVGGKKITVVPAWKWMLES